MTVDASVSGTELHTRDTVLCVAAVATRSRGASVGSVVGVVVGGGVVVIMTSVKKIMCKFIVESVKKGLKLFAVGKYMNNMLFAGLEKIPIQWSGTTRFSFRASNLPNGQGRIQASHPLTKSFTKTARSGPGQAKWEKCLPQEQAGIQVFLSPGILLVSSRSFKCLLLVFIRWRGWFLIKQNASL